MCRRNKFKHPDILEIKHRVKEFNYDKNIIKLVGLMLTFEDYKRICLDDVLKFNWYVTATSAMSRPRRGRHTSSCGTTVTVQPSAS